MKIAGRNAAPIRTGIDDFNHLLRVQRELSVSDAYHRAIRRAQQRRIRKPGFTEATGKDGLNSQKSSESTYIFGYNPKTDKWATNKGDKTLGNFAAPEWGERVLDLGSIVLATPAGAPFAPIGPDTSILNEIVEIEVTIGFTGRA